MEAAVIDKIVALAPANLIPIDGLQYSDKKLTLVSPPIIHSLQSNTLQGLVELLSSGFEGITSETAFVQVLDHGRVNVVNRKSDEYSQRIVAIEATVLGGDRSFTFNQLQDVEASIIGLQACFTADGDHEYVLKTISSIATDDKLHVEDNGVAQSVTVKGGITLVNQVEVKPRVSLAPYRTFREVEQPKSDFILRIKKGSDGLPKVGLFEADGGAWKMDAIHNVRDWLKAELANWTIVA